MYLTNIDAFATESLLFQGLRPEFQLEGDKAPAQAASRNKNAQPLKIKSGIDCRLITLPHKTATASGYLKFSRPARRSEPLSAQPTSSGRPTYRGSTSAASAGSPALSTGPKRLSLGAGFVFTVASDLHFFAACGLAVVATVLLVSWNHALARLVRALADF